MKTLLRILLTTLLVVALVIATVAIANAEELRETPFNWVMSSDPQIPQLPNSYYFSEGSLRGGFEPFLLLFNPDDSVARSVAVIYWSDGTVWVSNDFYVPANSRRTANLYRTLCPSYYPDPPDFSIGVFSDDPTFYAERSQFWQSPQGRIGTGWGPSQPGTRFVFAEGCTAYGFEEYLTVLNPGQTTANATIRLSGCSSTVNILIYPYSRATLNVGDLVSSDVSAVVESDTPVVVERVMYAPGRSSGYVNGGQK